MNVTIVGVRVFDGTRLLDGRSTLTVEGDVIGAIEPYVPPRDPLPDDGSIVDGVGGTLLPGLVDAHVHLRGLDDLRTLAAYGVTTALDMGTWPPSLVADLRRAEGVTDIRSSGAGAVGPGSLTAKLPGRPADSIVSDPDAGRRFVAVRAAEDVDYLKVIVEPLERGGFDQETLKAMVEAAHAAGLMVIAHTPDVGGVTRAQAAGVDVLTHAPIDGVLDDAAVADALQSGRTVVPTLTMMEGVVRTVARPGASYAHARGCVTGWYRAGVPIVLGTDANQAPGVPANVPHGESAHHELALLVDAGLTPVEALRSATSVAAARFGLPDRGRIEVGKRADLLLVDGDPTSDVSATRAISGVWIAGQRTT